MRACGSQRSLIKKNLFKVCEELSKQLTPPVFLLFGTDFAKTNETSLHPPRNKTLSLICSCMKTVICVAAVRLSVFLFCCTHYLFFFFCNKNNRMSFLKPCCLLSFICLFFYLVFYLHKCHSKNSPVKQHLMLNRCGAAVINAVLQMFFPCYEIKANSHNIGIHGTLKKNHTSNFQHCQ